MTAVRKRHIRLRRGTAEQWTEANPVLRLGEQGYETDTVQLVGGVCYHKFKIGDGETAWNDLPYMGLGNPVSEGGGGTVAWADITGKPTEFTPSAHTHGWSEITGKPSTFAPSAHGHGWDEITGKPTEFTPSAHGHGWDEITGKPTEFTPSAHSHSWDSITGKPTEFTPSSHAHTASQISDFAASVRDTLLTGLAPGTNEAIVGTDAVMVALAKLQAQISVASENLDLRIRKVDAPRFVLADDGPSITGGAGIVAVRSIRIPANTFSAGFELLVRTRIRKTGTVGSTSTYLYVNTADSLSGAILAATLTSGSSNIFIQMKRDLVVKAEGTEVFRTNLTSSTDDTTTNVQASLLAIDWTVDQYIITAVNSTSTSDSFINSMFLVEGRKTIS